MKILPISILIFFISFSLNAQSKKDISFKEEIETIDTDTIISDTIYLEELVISKGKINYEAKKQFELLRNRVYVTYPYARLASEKLTNLTKGMARLKSNRDKKKYFKIVENYITNEFEAKLKKLSRKQGQILIKLIHRQTGITTYKLVKDLKSGWSAFWSSTTAKLFDLDMNMPYKPYEVNEDFLIEAILVSAFEANRLPYQKPVNPVNFEKLSKYWEEKSLKN